MVLYSFEQVIKAAKQNEGWAFESLYRHLSAPVASYIKLRGITDYESVTSEVFIAVLKRMNSFEGNEKQFRSFVFSIAHNKIIDEYRKSYNRFAELEIKEDLLHQKAYQSTEDIVLGSFNFEELLENCAQLSNDQKDVLLLRILGNFSVEETGKILNKTSSSIKSLQYRALEHLRKNLSKKVQLYEP